MANYLINIKDTICSYNEIFAGSALLTLFNITSGRNNMRFSSQVAFGINGCHTASAGSGNRLPVDVVLRITATKYPSDIGLR